MPAPIIIIAAATSASGLPHNEELFLFEESVLSMAYLLHLLMLRCIELGPSLLVKNRSIIFLDLECQTAGNRISDRLSGYMKNNGFDGAGSRCRQGLRTSRPIHGSRVTATQLSHLGDLSCSAGNM